MALRQQKNEKLSCFVVIPFENAKLFPTLTVSFKIAVTNNK